MTHTPNDREELLHALVDGLATEEQRARAAELLERDPEARRELAQLEGLSELLARIDRPDPPPDLAPAVLAALRAQRAALPGPEPSRRGRLGATVRRITNLFPFRVYEKRRPAPYRLEGIMASNGRNRTTWAVSLGAAALAVVAIVIYFGGLYPPAREDAYGTIGAAKRYHADQITAADVRLADPEVQQFLSSDTFDRIARDPEARQALSNDAVKAALSNDALRDMLANEALRNALKDDAMKQALTSDALKQALSNDAMRNALRNDAAVQALSNQAVRDALRNDAWAQALNSKALKQALSNDAAWQALQNDAFKQALRNDALRNAITSDAMMNVLKNDAMRNAITNDALKQALTNDALRDALRSDALKQAISNHAILQALSNRALSNALSSGALGNALDARVNQ